MIRSKVWHFTVRLQVFWQRIVTYLWTWLFEVQTGQGNAVTRVPCRRNMQLNGRIVVYSIVGCPHCMKAKSTLQALELPYEDISLDSYPQCRDDMKRRTGKNTVPQVFFNAIYVGGNEALQNAVSL